MDATERHRVERERRAVFYQRWEAENRRWKRRIAVNAAILAVLVALLVAGLLLGWR